MAYLQRAKRLAGHYWRGGVPWAMLGVAKLRTRQHYIKHVWSGATPLAQASRVALLVHYNGRGQFLGYFKYLVHALEQAGFAVIVVSNSPKIDPVTLEQILPLCAAVIHRKNVGLDFGAWRDGLTLISNPAELEGLILTNDSVFGPLKDLTDVLRRCDFDAADVWGMTDAYDHRYHLQSYFLVLGKAALANNAFREFWSRVRYMRHKPAVIRFYEIGLTQKLMAGGLRVRALFPYPQVARAIVDRVMTVDSGEHSFLADHRDFLLRHINAGAPLNPTHFFWDYLITEAGFPFIKRELIEKNPMGIPFMLKWRSVVQDCSEFPVELIEEYLRLHLRGRVF